MGECDKFLQSLESANQEEEALINNRNVLQALLVHLSIEEPVLIEKLLHSLHSAIDKIKASQWEEEVGINDRVVLQELSDHALIEELLQSASDQVEASHKEEEAGINNRNALQALIEEFLQSPQSAN